MKHPKVSVCMVTYNQQQYIAQAIDSVLAQQTDFAVEIVIGEDCSTDGTRAIVEEYARRHPDRIRLLPPERNLGGKANFMRTFAECRGEYAAILEGDDYWTNPHKLQTQVDLLDKRRDWAICFHPAEIIYDDGRSGASRWPEHWDKPEATLVDLFNSDFIPTNAAVFRNKLFGAFPGWFSTLLVGDWPLHMLNAQYGNIGFVAETMSVYRVHARGLWSSKSHGEQMLELMRMLTVVDHHFHGQYAGPIDECRANILKSLIDPARAAESARDWLTEENRALRDQVRAFQRAILYRIKREAARPWKQLWNHSQRLLQRAQPHPDSIDEKASTSAA
jgi:glycosyltransferase involved in cell wall biosynthesis